MRNAGALSQGDRADDEGRFQRARTVTLSRGDTVRFAVSSSDFDPVARVIGPSGTTWDDDDGAGHGTDALLQFTAPEDGRYELVVTSYSPGEEGHFQTEFSAEHGSAADDRVAEAPQRGADPTDDSTDEGSDDAADDGPEPSATPTQPQAPGAGTTYGVFVGISHYGGENHDLPGSDTDAQNLERAFERAGWMQRSNAVVLTDASATLDQVRQAFRSLAPRVTARDTLVFFFDGHGNESALELRGEDLSRRELGRALDRVAGHSLVVLDSCNAGGFASVVRGHPGRAGLFSSRVDEESSTAPEVGAGGWLAWHFRRAVEGGVRRRADGSIDLDDVVRYVESGYRQRNLNEQHLVAVNDTRGGFAIGGTGDATNTQLPTNVAVASNASVPDAPTSIPAAAGVPGGGEGFPAVNADSVAQAVNLGVGLAGQMIQAFTK